MSIWSDMQDRSAGISLSKEDYNLLYGGGDLRQLHKDTYKNMRYEITAKDFPCIEIISKLDISIFSGSGQVILKDAKNTYELKRMPITISNCVYFFYECNKKGDHIPDVRDGHLYNLDELKSLAEKLIDLILKAENNLFNEAD